jgi:hypothetical protein
MTAVSRSDRKQPARERPAPQPRTGLPRQAREGLIRAWLEILRQRHPAVVWVVCDQVSDEERNSEGATPGAERPGRAAE